MLILSWITCLLRVGFNWITLLLCVNPELDYLSTVYWPLPGLPCCCVLILSWITGLLCVDPELDYLTPVMCWPWDWIILQLDHWCCMTGSLYSSNFTWITVPS